MPAMSLSPSPPAEILHQELRTFTLQKASRWRGKQGSPYNTARMRLVYNAVAPILFDLAEYCDPDDILNLRSVILKPVRKFDIRVAQQCREVAETVKELWSLGVFHWKDCRAIVLGSAIAAPAPLDMARRKGKTRKKGGKRSRKPGPQKGSRGVDGSWKVARAEEEGPLAPSTTRAQDSQASSRGGRAEFPIRHVGGLFNPSTINAHDEGDPDVTMADLSPVRAPADDPDPPLGDDGITEYTGVDIFSAASSHDARDNLPAPSSSGTAALGSYRSLEDAYADNPDARLSNLDEQTLSLAGKAVRQVVLEATFEFLQKCIPASDQQRVWDHILGRGLVKESEISSIIVPDGTLGRKNGTRPISHLMGDCIGILSQDFSIANQKTLRLALDRGIALCDALNDRKRRTALECALNSLSWLMLGLDCKTMEVYRHANQELERINANYSEIIGQGTISSEGICNARGLEERNLLRSMKSSFEHFKEPFRVNFIHSVQRLLAA